MVNRKSILVTRPSGQAYSLINRLSSIGCQVIYQPMLEIQKVECSLSPESKSISDGENFQHVIFVSINSVRFGLPHILSNRLFSNENINYYTVGSATAELLSKSGIKAIFPEKKMTSEGLLELASFSEISGDNVALIKGEGGREYLAKTLEERGGKVVSFDCYRRVPAKIKSSDLVKLMRENNIDMAIFSSAEAILNFLSLIDKKLNFFSELTLLVASHRIAEIARSAGWQSNLLVAENAMEDSFVDAVAEWLLELEK